MRCGSVLLQFPCVFYFHFFFFWEIGWFGAFVGEFSCCGVFCGRNEGWIKIIVGRERFWGEFRPMSYFAGGFVEGRLIFCREEEESWFTLR